MSRLTIPCVALAVLAALPLSATAPADRTGCKHPAPPARPVSEWTVMVFMNGDNNLESAALRDLEEMGLVGSTDQLNVVVQLDLLREQGTRRFRVTKGMTSPPTARSTALGEVNMGDGASLACFITWSLAAFPARKTALIVWDHGQGWRDPGAAAPSPEEEARLSPNRSPLEAPYRSASHDDTDDDELLNRETADAIGKALRPSGRRIDVLAFDACLMAMLETAYAFRDVASHLVASQELVPARGFDYADWLGSLAGAPGVETGRTLAQLLVSSFARQYEGLADVGLTRREQTLAAVDLTTVAAVSDAVSRVASRLVDLMPGVADAVAQARCGLPLMAPRDGRFLHVDLDAFLERLSSITTDGALLAALAEARAALGGSTVARYPEQDRGGVPDRGLAIYFPSTLAQYRADGFAKGGYRRGNLTAPVAFVEDFEWGDLLSRYWAEPVPACALPPAPGGSGPVLPDRGPRSSRQALVVGNSAYPGGRALTARDDATSIADALRQLGFDVTLRVDRAEAALRADLETFLGSLTSGDTVLVYFAGHGLQLPEDSYLVPIDAVLERPDDVARHAYAMGDLYRDPRFRGTARRLVILDACRTNRWQRSGPQLPQGLARPLDLAVPSETFLAYAAEPGGRAADGDVPDHDGVVRSPYAMALLRYLRRPGIPIEEVFRRTRELVRELTQRMQTPWESTSLTTRFQLREGARVTATLSDCDDVVYLRDERQGLDVLACGLGEARTAELSLEPGENPFVVQVFNQKTCEGGFCAFWSWGEGWKYRLDLVPTGGTPTTYTGGEDRVVKDGDRHGRTFPVKRFAVRVGDGDPSRSDGEDVLTTTVVPR